MLLDVRTATAMATAGRDVEISADDTLYLAADETMLRQALVNLVENAAKYSTPQGAIRLSASKTSDDVVELCVEDKGPGIDPEDLPHIFDRFYRAREQSRRVKGSGLGLAIVKGFVQLSGGTVHAESSPTGTRFVIRLPVAAPAKATA
jgi:signal transduction histidine kinase